MCIKPYTGDNGIFHQLNHTLLYTGNKSTITTILGGFHVYYQGVPEVAGLKSFVEQRLQPCGCFPWSVCNSWWKLDNSMKYKKVSLLKVSSGYTVQHTHACTCTDTHPRVHRLHMYMHTHALAHTHTCTHINTYYTHMHMQTHMHTHIDGQHAPNS